MGSGESLAISFTTTHVRLLTSDCWTLGGEGVGVTPRNDRDRGAWLIQACQAGL